MSDGPPDHAPWRTETITAGMLEVLRALQERTVLEGAYLAGRTGLALRLGHRLSVDLDFFIGEALDEDMLLRRIQRISGIAGVQRAPQTLHLIIQGVKVSLLGYSYPLLFAAEKFESVPVADPRDIACMKIAAIASRGSKRDFVDLYAACRLYGLPEVLVLFRRKYAQVGYSGLHIIKSLTYFADAEKDPMPHMLAPFDWRDVKKFFEREAPRLH